MCAHDVYDVPGVQVIPGGVVRPPGDSDDFANLDIHFGRGHLPACLAETMIMTATRAYTRKSLGSHTQKRKHGVLSRARPPLGVHPHYRNLYLLSAGRVTSFPCNAPSHYPKRTLLTPITHTQH